ncbi:SH3 domain-containing protein [Bacillus cereus]|uniref:SH3 domain-containing protein n=1 Tax=Bacillus cereus TaxID=1396 RepID=UPI003BF76114
MSKKKQEPAQNCYLHHLNVRSGAGINYEVIGVVEPNQKIQVLDSRLDGIKSITMEKQDL